MMARNLRKDPDEGYNKNAEGWYLWKAWSSWISWIDARAIRSQEIALFEHTTPLGIPARTSGLPASVNDDDDNLE
jgi:hypothetical protein